MVKNPLTELFTLAGRGHARRPFELTVLNLS
jgi:hypothetical protein